MEEDIEEYMIKAYPIVSIAVIGAILLELQDKNIIDASFFKALEIIKQKNVDEITKSFKDYPEDEIEVVKKMSDAISKCFDGFITNKNKG